MKGSGGLLFWITAPCSVLVLHSKSEAEMASLDKETLHTYLRRHFEKVSKGNAKQFVEQMEKSKGVSECARSPIQRRLEN